MLYYDNLSLEPLFYINKEGLVCQEIFKDVPNYLGSYQASDLGRAKSLDRIISSKTRSDFKLKGKILSQTTDKEGRLFVGLMRENKKIIFVLSKLVAITFLNHIPCGHKKIVDHKNNYTLDNRLSNLQIITHRENLSKDKKNKSSEYTGVCYASKRNKWRVSISIDGENFSLAECEKEYDAHVIYQKALKNTHLFNGNRSEFRNKIKSL